MENEHVGNIIDVFKDVRYTGNSEEDYRYFVTHLNMIEKNNRTQIQKIGRYMSPYFLLYQNVPRSNSWNCVYACTIRASKPACCNLFFMDSALDFTL